MSVFLVEFVCIMADFHALNACNAAMAVACTVLFVKKHLWCTELTWSSYCKIFFCTQKTCNHFCIRRVGTRGSCAYTASCLPSNSCGMCNQKGRELPKYGTLFGDMTWFPVYFQKTLNFLVFHWNIKLKTSKHEFVDRIHQNKQGLEGKKLSGREFILFEVYVWQT